jgi:hypothetical protein
MQGNDKAGVLGEERELAHTQRNMNLKKASRKAVALQALLTALSVLGGTKVLLLVYLAARVCPVTRMPLVGGGLSGASKAH